ncbi:hypothetical protein V3I01_08000 [Sphingomonas sp. gentR]|uniref:hypothetical protein n=1 Tax=unclassified Sphingomonas TaxID=196159 RepID=UPI0012EC9151|nr:hypothetical protein [Sphingomonas sp. LK11]
MMWDILNVFGRLLLTAIAVYKLSQFRDHMIAMERIGLGFMGGGSFLTIPIIIDRYNNPFNGWATSVLTFGAVLFLAGRTWRDRRHEQANAHANREASDYLKSRGKL